MKLYIVLFVGIFAIASTKNYEGYKVYRVIPQDENQINLLKALHEMEVYDFWTGSVTVGRPVDIMVSKDMDETFNDLCQKYALDKEIFITDVQKLLNAEKKSVSLQRIEDGRMSWDQYYTLGEIYLWMDQLAERYPSKVSISIVGETYENRPIKVLKISYGEGKKAVYIEGGIHAREWITPATTSYLITQLLTSNDPIVRKIAESYDWFIVPIANPDGYAYTHETERLWRKNRAPHTTCYGTDGNRNWDIYWGVAGTSTNECDETYGGPKAASELETIHLSKFIASIGSRLDIFLSFHSYGNMFLMPYGHTEEHLDNYDDVLAIGLTAAQALESINGTKYVVGNTAETIYSHSGGTMDWVKFNFQPPIAFTYEMRGDPGGFVLPPEYILPNCEEIMTSITTIFVEGDKRGLIKLE